MVDIKTPLLVVLFHLLYAGFPLGFVATPLWLVFGSSSAGSTMAGGAWIVAYVLWFFATHAKETDGHGLPWRFFVNLPLFTWMFSWFPMKIETSGVKLDPSRPHVFACHPHGTLCFNRGMFGFATKALWDEAFPGVDFRVLTATAALRVPVIRELWLWSYCVDASKHVARRVLRLGKSVLVYPGGEREQIATVRGVERLYLSRRKGFVKIALEVGAPLVPVYVFGESDLYTHHSLGLGFRKWLVKTFGAAVMLISGSIGLLPHRVPITAVAGEPIAIEKHENPSNEVVEETHKRYVAALIKLFDENKERLGYGNRKLIID